MGNRIKWNEKEEGNGIVRLSVDLLSKLPTIEEYKEHISELLGLDKIQSQENLKDQKYSADLADSILLYQELEKIEISAEGCRKVIFAGPNGDIIVDAANFNKVFDKLKSGSKEEKTDSASKELIDDVLEELWGGWRS